VIFVAYSRFYLIQALAPETRADANVYHLMPAVESIRSGGFRRPDHFYETPPARLENLFAMAYSVGGSSSAKHDSSRAIPGRRSRSDRIGPEARRFRGEIAAIAAALYLCTPVAGGNAARPLSLTRPWCSTLRDAPAIADLAWTIRITDSCSLQA